MSASTSVGCVWPSLASEQRTDSAGELILVKRNLRAVILPCFIHCIIACTIPTYYVTCNYAYSVAAASTNKSLSQENNH